MKLNKCFFCNKITYTPVHLTEVNENGTVDAFDLCANCAEKYMNDIDSGTDKSQDNNPNIIDLTHITTPEQLLSLLTNVSPESGTVGACECGMTEKEFEEHGRFGCPKCYTHFKEKMEKYVFPFHKGREHNGKRPKAHFLEVLMQNPVEKLKILKLRYAKALELEQYEKAAEIKKEIDLLNSEQTP